MENNSMDSGTKGIAGILKSVSGLLAQMAKSPGTVVIFILAVYAGLSWWNERGARASESEVKNETIQQLRMQVITCDSENREAQNRYNELQNSLLRKNGIIDTIKSR